MLKRSLIYFSVAVLLISCASTGKSSRLGTGKPKFASLEIEGVSYFLSSETGTFSHGKPLNLVFRVTNISAQKKKFMTENNIFLILQVKNEFRESLENLNIPADRYLKDGSFSLDPGEERVFEIPFTPERDEYKVHGSIYCQIRLFFLPKQFRRNTVSIYVEKK
ncbi:MAG: hypothetical protein JXN63_05130 [Candidatus Delongbacteria bacterium]|nr:hypothetical protein [Candidatus Delongbacteria bacterium]